MLRIRNLLALAGLGALLAIVVLFAGVTMRQGADHALPAADAAPATTTATTTTTASATAGTAKTDDRGYVESAARCAEGQTAVAFGRTQRSEVVICAVEGGDYEYIGVRSSDGATLQTTAESTDDGFVARTDGATYTVSPAQLVVVSGGKVIYRDTWIDYHQPQISSEEGSTTSTTTSTTTTSTTAPTTTTSTTATSTTAATTTAPTR
jgi:hypothetical protein